MKLSDRVEALAGPDRAIDAEIAVASGFYVYEKRGRDRQEWFYPTNGESYFKRSIHYGSTGLTLERYTADLNAALSLVPEECTVSLNIDRDKQSEATLESGWDTFCGYAATPALALCAAALRARGL
jgi:hypothetical protein